MRIIAQRTLREYWEIPEHKGAEPALRAWYSEASKAEWKNLNEVKAQYRNASIVGDDKVVFNIKGNDYRLVVSMNFKFSAIYILFIGTHKAYDKINIKKL